MISSRLIDRSTGRIVAQGGPELIDRWQKAEETWLWMIVQDEDPASEADLLMSQFGVHDLAIADVQRSRHPPKIEEFEDHTLVMLKGLDAQNSSLESATIQLSQFVGGRFLVTRCSGRSLSTERVVEMLEQGDLGTDVSSETVALQVVRCVGDRFLELLFRVENRIEDMETEMLESPSDRLLQELVRQKADLKQIVRILGYHARIFSEEVTRAGDSRFEHVRHQLNDVSEQQERQLSLARLFLELTDDLIDGYISLSAHKLNQIMMTLTIVTVIFVPITFMAGIYGNELRVHPGARLPLRLLRAPRCHADRGGRDSLALQAPRLAGRRQMRRGTTRPPGTA